MLLTEKFFNDICMTGMKPSRDMLFALIKQQYGELFPRDSSPRNEILENWAKYLQELSHCVLAIETAYSNQAHPYSVFSRQELNIFLANPGQLINRLRAVITPFTRLFETEGFSPDLRHDFETGDESFIGFNELKTLIPRIEAAVANFKNQIDAKFCFVTFCFVTLGRSYPSLQIYSAEDVSDALRDLSMDPKALMDLYPIYFAPEIPDDASVNAVQAENNNGYIGAQSPVGRIAQATSRNVSVDNNNKVAGRQQYIGDRLPASTEVIENPYIDISHWRKTISNLLPQGSEREPLLNNNDNDDDDNGAELGRLSRRQSSHQLPQLPPNKTIANDPALLTAVSAAIFEVRQMGKHKWLKHGETIFVAGVAELAPESRRRDMRLDQSPEAQRYHYFKDWCFKHHIVLTVLEWCVIIPLWAIVAPYLSANGFGYTGKAAAEAEKNIGPFAAFVEQGSSTYLEIQAGYNGVHYSHWQAVAFVAVINFLIGFHYSLRWMKSPRCSHHRRPDLNNDNKALVIGNFVRFGGLYYHVDPKQFPEFQAKAAGYQRAELPAGSLAASPDEYGSINLGDDEADDTQLRRARRISFFPVVPRTMIGDPLQRLITSLDMIMESQFPINHKRGPIELKVIEFRNKLNKLKGLSRSEIVTGFDDAIREFITEMQKHDWNNDASDLSNLVHAFSQSKIKVTDADLIPPLINYLRDALVAQKNNTKSKSVSQSSDAVIYTARVNQCLQALQDYCIGIQATHKILCDNWRRQLLPGIPRGLPADVSQQLTSIYDTVTAILSSQPSNPAVITPIREVGECIRAAFQQKGDPQFLKAFANLAKAVAKLREAIEQLANVAVASSSSTSVPIIDNNLLIAKCRELAGLLQKLVDLAAKPLSNQPQTGAPRTTIIRSTDPGIIIPGATVLAQAGAQPTAILANRKS